MVKQVQQQQQQQHHHHEIIRHRSHAEDEHVLAQRERLLRPPVKTLRQKTRDFFWDPVEKTCLTRTPSNWLAISFYYAIFIGVVFLFFYLSMEITHWITSANPDRPQYILQQSPIGNNPKVNFFPLYKSRNLIWLSADTPYDGYVDMIASMFKKYKKKNKKFNATIFGECGSSPYGYDTQTPCLFFRLNRLLMWTPNLYEKGDELPEDMPSSVRDLIESSENPKIWFTCNGTTAKDRDHISQEFFHVIGEKGFDPSAFPYKRQKNYVDAIIPVKFKDSKPRKVLYSFTCTVWLKEADASKLSVDVTYYFE